MRLQAVKVEGAQVRFSAPGGGKLRLWSGRWDGKKIAQLDVDEGDWDRAVDRLRTIQTGRKKN